jgi:hypothetical protein
MLGKTTKSEAALVLSHWYKLIENLQASSLDFYKRMEEAVQEKLIPELGASRIEWHEGGVLSAKREYLRLTRERLVFDICAAPFGKGFFVSWRLGEIPLRLSILGLLLIFMATCLVVWSIVQLFGVCWGFTIFIIALIALMWLMRTAVGQGLANVDSMLLNTPVIGAIYERFLRPITYYRIDLALMYQQAVHAALMQVIDELTKAQGIPPLSEFERKPILRELYKR